MKERILQIIKHLGVSNREFESKCGMSNGYINAMRRALGLEKLENVLRAYPQINREWLLTGEGTMLNVDATGPRPEIVADSDELTALRNEVERLKRVNETQAQTIRDQAAVLKALTTHSATHQENEVPLLSMPKPEYNKL